MTDLQVTRARDSQFRSHLFDGYYQRLHAPADTAIAETLAPARSAGEYVRGVSTAKVGHVLEALNGLTHSASTVSRVFHQLEPAFQAWKTRPLPSSALAVHRDGIELTNQYAGAGV